MRVQAAKPRVPALGERLLLALRVLGGGTPDRPLARVPRRAGAELARLERGIGERELAVARVLGDADETRRHVVAVGDRIRAAGAEEIRALRQRRPSDRRHRVVVAPRAADVVGAAALPRHRRTDAGDQRPEPERGRRVGRAHGDRPQVAAHLAVLALLEELHPPRGEACELAHDGALTLHGIGGGDRGERADERDDQYDRA
jgi:hypothetical protein